MNSKTTTFMSRLLAAVLAIVIPSTVLAQSCFLTSALPSAIQWAGGPNVYAAYVANPAVGTDILAAQDAWDVTDAANRIAGWSGTVTASDCPAGQPFQVGALDFATSNCATLIAYGANNAQFIGYTDFSPTACAQCGTRSVMVNLAYSWAVGGAPLAGQYHLRSLLAHEFGHVLGLAHMSNGVCTGAQSQSCAQSPGRETMGATFYNTGPAETCEADVAPNDISSANALY